MGLGLRKRGGEDLVLISRSPMTARVLSLGKYIYDQKKREKSEKREPMKMKEMRLHLSIRRGRLLA